MLRSEAWLFFSTNFSKGTLAREVSRAQKAVRFRRDQSFQMEPPEWEGENDLRASKADRRKKKKGSSDALRTKDKGIMSAAEKLEEEVLAHAEIAKKGGGIWGNID